VPEHWIPQAAGNTELGRLMIHITGRGLRHGHRL